MNVEYSMNYEELSLMGKLRKEYKCGPYSMFRSLLNILTDKKSDEVYDLFYQPIALKQDRSDVSKQSLIESIRLKVEMANSLAALAQAKAKLEMAKSKLQAGSGNVFINAQDGADVGINLKELWKDE